MRPSQAACPRTRSGISASLALLLLLSLGSACTSIYHRAQIQVFPDPIPELSLRMTEAKRAESLVEKAGATLLSHLQRGNTGVVIETDFDRLEATAGDLDRQVEAARDAAARCRQPGQFTSEIDRLNRKAQAWLEYVQTCRTAAPIIQLEKLRVRLP